MKFSVAMCTFNGAKYIEEQLLSILNQELPIHEIVVCDDGSNDNTIDVVNKVSVEHPEVTWNILQNNPNLGVTKNFEKAITLCTGDIIFLSDQDDIWHRNKTKVIIDYFEANPDKEIVFTDANIVGADGKLISQYSLLAGVLPYLSFWESGYVFEILNAINIATGATMAFKRKCLSDFIPFISGQKYLLHDHQIAISGCKNATLGICSERTIDYRQHDNNVIGIGNDSWIYAESPSIPHLLVKFVEPFPINLCFRNWVNERRLFYEIRNRNYSTVFGKVRLFFQFYKYIHYYHKYWIAFMISDILYGVVDYEGRKKLLDFFDKKWFRPI